VTNEQMKEFIEVNPKSDLAAAYALGMRDKALELSPLIEQLPLTALISKFGWQCGTNKDGILLKFQDKCRH
jgi:hypothetical protein